MNLKNNGIIAGNLVADPEMKVTAAGLAVANITVAVKNDYKNKTTDEYDTQFLPFALFGKKAEFVCQHFKKGDGIQLSFSLARKKVIDRNENRYNIELYADQIGFAKGLTINDGMVCGFLAEDPKAVNIGTTKCVNINVRVQNDYKSKESGKYESEFLPFAVFGKNADFVEKYFNKGAGIIIEFAVQRKKKVDRGENRHVNSLFVKKIKFGEKARTVVEGDNTSTAVKNTSVPPQATAPVYEMSSNYDVDPDGFVVLDDDDDLPF